MEKKRNTENKQSYILEKLYFALVIHKTARNMNSNIHPYPFV